MHLHGALDLKVANWSPLDQEQRKFVWIYTNHIESKQRSSYIYIILHHSFILFVMDECLMLKNK
jgi:hypothetical protein